MAERREGGNAGVESPGESKYKLTRKFEGREGGRHQSLHHIESCNHA